jgi:hemolysin D
VHPAAEDAFVSGANRNPVGSAGIALESPRGAPSPQSPSDLSYPAKVTLSRDWIDIEGHRETVQPGMQVSAEIKTGDRRAIEFLLSPVMQTLKEAGRER